MYLYDKRDVTHRAMLAAPVLGATTLLLPAPSLAQGILGDVKSGIERLKSDIEGDLKALREDVRDEAAYLLGMESYVYGYPLVVMDVTRQVLTAAPEPNSEGTAAPINQLASIM
jgi:hypothetical protein